MRCGTQIDQILIHIYVIIIHYLFYTFRQIRIPKLNILGSMHMYGEFEIDESFQRTTTGCCFQDGCDKICDVQLHYKHVHARASRRKTWSCSRASQYRKKCPCINVEERGLLTRVPSEGGKNTTRQPERGTNRSREGSTVQCHRGWACTRAQNNE